ncbi:MAG TPA: acetyl-CoA hydrolase/transferase C-terminal domain-containing protein, partial [Terricaulis sp.]|nr:acetyl-CoA hydrolase/transferase C-terminal domain-containing protein [Terricaulis sp.]
GAAAQRSAGGRSIIALPSLAGGASRIVSKLSGRTASLPRALSDTIVTEHGVAELRGKSLDARAEALIAIAAPAAREALERAWRALRTTL